MSTSHQNEDTNRGTSSSSSLNESRQSSHPNLFSWSGNRSSQTGSQKIRITILCAKALVKRDLFRLPDPFVKVSLQIIVIISFDCNVNNVGVVCSSQVNVDGSGQCHATEVCKNTLDPKWNVHYDLYVGVNDAITISVWNDKKVKQEMIVNSSAFCMHFKICLLDSLTRLFTLELFF